MAATATTVCRKEPANGKSPATTDAAGGGTPLHRLGEVRQQEGVTRRTVARRLGVSVADVKLQEEATTDLPLSRLHQWRKALNVPLVELLVDPDESLSPPLLKRAQLLRLMKTALSILEQTSQSSVERLAQTMTGQLAEIMPELQDVSPWHSVGRRRRRDECGRAAEQIFPDRMFAEHGHEAGPPEDA